MLALNSWQFSPLAWTTCQTKLHTYRVASRIVRFENLSPNLKSFSCLQFMCILDSVGNPTVSSLLANFLRFHYPHKSIKNIDKKCFEATRLTFSLLSVKASLTCLKKNLAMRNFCKCKSFASILQQSWLCLKTQ